MQFCSRCGGEAEQVVPEGDSRPRAVCTKCHHIHYDNPRMVVGCLVEDAGRVLMCKRAIDPRSGYWTLPGGFLELGETSQQGAIRETLEEANAVVEVVAPYTQFDIPSIGQIYMFYRARMLGPEFGAGPESLEVTWMTPQQLPWDELAFSVVRETLQLWVGERDSGVFGIHRGVVERNAEGRYVLVDHRVHGGRG